MLAGAVLAGTACAPADAPPPHAGSPPALPDGAPATATIGGEVGCEAPVAAGEPLPFRDVTVDAGLAYTPPIPQPDGQGMYGNALDVELVGGLVVGDFDGDGLLDVVVTDRARPVLYFRAVEPLRFQPVSAMDSGLHCGNRYISGGSAADFDGDADLDLVLLATDGRLLFRNRGDGSFEDVTESTGFGAEPWRGVGASWADFDRDGDLDAFIVEHGEGSHFPGDDYDSYPDVLFVQQPDGTFASEPHRVTGDAPDGYGFTGGWFDADGDGWLDLYVVNDLATLVGDAPPNVFLRNLGGDTPEDVRLEHWPQAGLDVPMASMGLAIGDLDLDGDLDVHVSDAGPTFLARNEGGLLFTDISLEIESFNSGLDGDVSWGTEFFDHDNDGRLELYTALGYMPTRFDGIGVASNPMDQYDTLLSWTLEDGWVDTAPRVGADDPAWNRTLVPADFDRDGFVDLLTWSMDEGPRLLRSDCNGAAWLRVRLRDPGSRNRDAVGARVEAWVDGWPRAVREVSAGSTGTMSGGPPEVYLGLGDAERATLAVRWPDGDWTVNADLPLRREVVLGR